MKQRLFKVACLFICSLLMGSYIFAADRYWVHQTLYENFFSTPAALSDWQLIEDNGTGGFTSSGHGTAILTMDDAAGSFANRLFNINGASPRLLPFDATNGRVEILVKFITGGNQQIFLQAQEFDGSGIYLGQVDIIPARSATGFFSVNLSTIIWDPSTVQVRFIIGGENFSGQQGTVEFGYFSYSNTNGKWDNAANWSTTSNGPGGASIPGASDNAIFDGAGNSNGSCLFDINVNINALSVTNGFSGNIDLQNFQVTIGAGGVNLAGGGITGATQNIQVNGDVTVSGGAFKSPTGNTYISGNISITGGILDFSAGTVVFNGNSDQQFGSSVITPINNLVIDKSSGAVNFNSDILIGGSLTLTQGILNANTYTVRLGTDAVNTGSLVNGSGKINGNFSRWIGPASLGNVLFPFGNVMANAPLVVQVISAPSSGGTITSFYTDAAPGFTPVNFPDNPTTILRRSTASWSTQTSGLTDGSYSLSLSDDHLAAITSLSDLHLTLTNTVVGSHQPAGGTLSNPVLNRSGLGFPDLTNTFYASLSSVALPITWLTFDMAQQAGNFTWNWSLSFEDNVYSYSPQYSMDGVHFTSAGKVTNLNFDHIYSFSAPLSETGTIFFRIQEVDKDGHASYSMIRTIASLNTPGFSFYPNPVKDKLIITWPYSDATRIYVTITDGQGKLILDRNTPYAISFFIYLTGFAPGTYFIHCSDNKQHQSGTYLLMKVKD